MEYLVKLSGMAVALLVLLTACQTKETNKPIIEGVYEGTVTGLQTESTDGTTESKTSVSEIIVTGENEIQVHCYSENFDTTFVMNYYMDNDSAYVCYTGDEFEKMYSHILGEGHMRGMMEDMHKGETEWMHHMNEEHHNGDEHFGGFDLKNHSFSYTFQMNRSDASDDLHFKGIRK
jgi:hypothetical protein